MSNKRLFAASVALLAMLSGSLIAQNQAPAKDAAPVKDGVKPMSTSDVQPTTSPTPNTSSTPTAMPMKNPMAAPGTEMPTPTQAEFTPETLNHDYGKIASGKPQPFKFAFKNTGTERLIIQQVRTSCGCTAAALDIKEFEPGQGSTIDITFNPKGKGAQAKTITVIHNGKNGPETMLNIKADVYEAVEVQPPTLQLGEMVRGKERVERVVLVSDDKDLKIKSIDVNGEMVTAKESTDGASGNADPRPGKIAIDITFDGNLPVGRFLRIITIKALASPTPGAPQEEWELKINAFANIVGDLKADPANLRVAATEPNKEFVQETFITRRSGGEFQITSATAVNANLPGLNVKYEPAEVNGVKGYKVIFSGNTGPTAGIIRGNVLLKTDVADEPEFRVSFTGMVRDPNAPKPQAVPANPMPAPTPTPAKPQ